MAAVKQYWGAAAIMERIGYSRGSRPNLPEIIEREGVPVKRRRKPGTFCHTYYTDEDLIQRWQLAQAKLYRDHILQCKAAGIDRRYKALDRKRKVVGT